MGVIYMLTFSDGRKYIGQTVNLRNRLTRHRTAARSGARVHVSRAWAVLGEPTCDVLCNVENNLLDAMEREFINQHATLFPSGLNRDTGGERGASPCEETRQLHADANRVRYEDPAERNRTRQSMLDRYKDPVERQKASDIQKERYKSQAAREKTSEAMKKVGARPAEQQRKSNATRALWADDAYRTKLIAAKLVSAPKGENCSWSKITSEMVVAIRAERQAGIFIAQVAAKYGISQASVSSIANRKAWKHIL